jgi:hypothetical protein
VIFRRLYGDVFADLVLSICTVDGDDGEDDDFSGNFDNFNDLKKNEVVLRLLFVFVLDDDIAGEAAILTVCILSNCICCRYNTKQ